MTFQIRQRVAYPAFGLGRIAGLAMKSFLDAELREFFEVVGEYSTVWVPVSEAASRGLRRLTRQDELARYRDLLRSQPVELSPDARLRHRDTQTRIKRGTLQDLCEIVRDLSAFDRHTGRDEYDVVDLRKSQHWLCQEWAAADGISLGEATAAVSALLLEARHAYGGALLSQAPVDGPPR